MIRIYHNPRCGKSRDTLKILNSKINNIEVIEYLKQIPSKKELIDLLKVLSLKPSEILRKGEQPYKDLIKGKELSDNEIIDIILTYPILIERPIVINNNQAVIARPPEKVLDII